MLSEQRNQPTVFRRCLEWAWTGLRVGLALTTLYVCLFITQFLLLIPNLSRIGAKSGGAFELDVSKAPLDPKSWYVSGEVTGRVLPNSSVEVTISQPTYVETQRTYVETSNFEGRVSIPIQLPPLGEARIEISTRPPGEKEPREDSIVYRGNISQPVIDLAVAAEDSNLLWISGRAPGASHGGLVILESETGEFIEPVSAFDGIFEKVFTPKSPVPARIRAREDLQPASFLEGGLQKISESTEVSFVSELPLERSIQIHFDKGVPVVQLEAKMPENDPHLQAFARRYLTQQRFAKAIWGWWPKLRDNEVEQDISIQNGLGIVRLTGTWFGPVNEIKIGDRYAVGLGEQLLLSANDSVEVNFEGVKPKWFDSPLPTELNENTACWQGPLILPPSGLCFGIKLPENIVAQTPEEVSRKKLELESKPAPTPTPTPRTIGDFFATDRYSSDESWLKPAWRNLVALLPCLGFLWLASRKRFGRSEVWPPAAAAVAILGASSLSYLLYIFLEGVTHPWFDQLIRIGRGTVPIDTAEIPLGTFAARSNAFLFLYLGIAGLAPSYFQYVMGYWDERKPSAIGTPSSFARIARTTWLTGRMFWGVLWGMIFFATVAWVTANHPWKEDTGLWVAQLLQKHLPSLKISAEQVTKYINQSDLFNQDDLWLVCSALLAVPLSLTLGLRGAMFGLGSLLVILRFIEPQRGALLEIERSTRLFSVIHKVPWWAVIAAAVVVSYLFIIRLLRWLLPREQLRLQRRRVWLVSAALVCLSAPLPFLPAKLLLLISGIALFTILVFVLLSGARDVEPVRSIAQQWGIWPSHLLLLGAVLGLILAWPVPGKVQLKFYDLFYLFSIYRSVVLFLVAALFLLLLKDYSDEHLKGGLVLEPSILWAGVVLFAVFVTWSPNTWALVPVPFLVAWLVAKFWLIRWEIDLGDTGRLETESSDKWKERITGALASIKAQSRMQTIEKALDKKLESTELTPDEYKQKLKSYRDYLYQNVALPIDASDRPLAETLFLLPRAKAPWPIAMRFVQVGALLAVVPLFITLYDYLPTQRVSYPYPTADLLSVLLRSIAGWLLIAFFFGFFYIHIRGSSGLKKGLALSAAVILPAGTYRLLNVPALGDLQPFLFWMTQVFAFCTLLGGVSDYRTLHKYGYKLRDQLTLDNLPWISIYASSIVAAVAPAIIALISGQVGNVAKFLIDLVLPPHAKGTP